MLHKYLTDPGLRSRFDAARLHWRQYRGWGMLEVEEIMGELARGDRSLQSICYAQGWDRNKYLRILYLIARAPEVEAQYHRAKRSQLARTGEQLFEAIGEVSTKKETRELSRKMHVARVRMPKKIREVFQRDQTPIERARHAAGMRLNGKPRERP